jgi:hypothetical protein
MQDRTSLELCLPALLLFLVSIVLTNKPHNSSSMERTGLMPRHALTEVLPYVHRARISFTQRSFLEVSPPTLSTHLLVGVDLVPVFRLQFRAENGREYWYRPLRCEFTLLNGTVTEGWAVLSAIGANSEGDLLLQLLKDDMAQNSDVVRWNTNGDHPLDACRPITDSVTGEVFLSEGKVVRRFRHPDFPGSLECSVCGRTMHDHGWIDSGGDGQTVCPGSLIVPADSGGYTVTPPNL